MEENIENVVENEDKYGTKFHERDSLTENNIVKEVKDSFLHLVRFQTLETV